MNLSIIKEVLSGEPSFRFKQVYKAIFVDFISAEFKIISKFSRILPEVIVYYYWMQLR